MFIVKRICWIKKKSIDGSLRSLFHHVLNKYFEVKNNEFFIHSIFVLFPCVMSQLSLFRLYVIQQAQRKNNLDLLYRPLNLPRLFNFNRQLRGVKLLQASNFISPSLSLFLFIYCTFLKFYANAASIFKKCYTLKFLCVR